jgi:hypothetical protein
VYRSGFLGGMAPDGHCMDSHLEPNRWLMAGVDNGHRVREASKETALEGRRLRPCTDGLWDCRFTSAVVAGR